MMWAATPFASAASWGEVRNDWPTTETFGAAPSCLIISQTISEPSSRLPASITASVSMKASRARSMASGGSDFGSKPTTKSAMVSLRRFATASALASGFASLFPSCASAGCPNRVNAPTRAEKQPAINRAFVLWDHRHWASLSSSTGPRTSSSKFNERNQVSKSARSTKIIASACVLPVHRSVASMIVLVEFAIS